MPDRAARRSELSVDGRMDGGRWLAYIANPSSHRVRRVATRNVVLTDAQSDLVNRLVASGRYQNASEALRAGLRLLEREEAELNELRARLAAGLEQARSGDLAEGDGEAAVRRAFATASEMEDFFRECDTLDGPASEPDWNEHLSAIDASRREGAATR